MRKDRILYDIKEALRAYSSDAKTTNAYILHLVNVARAKYLRQHQRRNPGESKTSYTQTMFLDLETVDRSYVPEVVTGLTILRTKKVLPDLIGKNILKNVEVRPVDRIKQEIEYLDKSRAIYGGSELFVFSFLDDDDHIYFVNKNDNIHKFLTKVAVTAILFEPDAITDINELTTELVEYPMPASLWALIKDEVLAQLMPVLQIPVDEISDNKTIQ